MDPIARFFGRHQFVYVLAIVGATAFGLFALGRAFREETRLATARDVGLAALAAGEVGGLIAIRDKMCAEAEMEEPAETMVAA